MKTLNEKRRCLQIKKATRKAPKRNQKNLKKRLQKAIRSRLVKHLYLGKSTASFIANAVCALISARAIWLKIIAQASENNGSKATSFVRRLQRFFCSFSICYVLLSTLLYRSLGSKRVTIILDRTNWKYGNKNINILVAAALYKRPGQQQASAVPLVWEVFSKRGNSNTPERIDIMQKVFRAIGGKENIEMVLADREFIGSDWIQFLHDNNIPFVIRIKKMMYVEFEGKTINALGLIGTVKQDTEVAYNVKINGILVQLVATRSSENDLVVTIASMSVKGRVLNEYRKRWLIELFFKSIKSQGFAFEQTHITDSDRIKALFALVALATLVCVLAGSFKASYKKIPIKNHGRPAFSIFTYGLDFVRELFRGELPTWLPKKTFFLQETQRLKQPFLL
jgi:hypothetical protein